MLDDYVNGRKKHRSDHRDGLGGPNAFRCNRATIWPLRKRSDPPHAQRNEAFQFPHVEVEGARQIDQTCTEKGVFGGPIQVFTTKKHIRQ